MFNTSIMKKATFLKLQQTIFAVLLLSVSINVFAQESEESSELEEKKFQYVVAPAYDYRPVIEHAFAIFNKNILKLNEDRLYVSEATFTKSFSNKSYHLNTTHELFSNNWRYYLTGTYANMINKVAGSEMGIPIDNKYLGLENKILNLQGFVKRKVASDLYVGLGYEILDIKSNSYLSDLGPIIPTPDPTVYVPLPDLEVNMFLSQPEFILEYDTRDDVVYPTNGFFVNVQSNLISDAFGSKIENIDENMQVVELDDYMFTRNFISAKYYHSFSGDWKSVLASRFSIRASTGDLPVSIWENTNNWIRGYTKGDYVGKQLYYLDLEWRKYITNRFGFVAFGTAGFIGEDFGSTFDSDRFVPAAGAGLRIQLMKTKRVAFRFDYARGRDGDDSVYFGLSEYF